MDKFLGFKTEEILTCLLLVVVGYFIAKIFSRSCANRVDGFSVGAARQCQPGGLCHSFQQWEGGRRDFPCPTKTMKNLNIEKHWCPDFCNFDEGDAGCPTNACDTLCTGVPSLDIPGIYQDSSGMWVNQCIKGPASPPPAPTPPAPTPPAPAPSPPAPSPSKFTCVRDSRGNPGSCIPDKEGDFDTLKNCQDNCKALDCTYSGDNKTKTNPRSFKDYVNEEKLDELECPDVQIKIDECKDAWRNYYNDKGVPYYGSFCMQTLPDETMAGELKGRGHCPLMHVGPEDARKAYPANWITNGQKFSIEEAKNQCKLSYLKGGGIPVGTIDEQENAPGRYAWVSETNDNDCDCPGSPPPPPPPPPPGPSPPGPSPAPTSICKDKNLKDGTINPGKNKGDCPNQTPDQTCCYDTSKIPTDFYLHYKNETNRMQTNCENDLHGTFTGPKSHQEVIDLKFPDLTGQTNASGESIAGNELFCYYNHTNDESGKPDPEHLIDHKKYCGDNPEYESGHGYFCSFPSNKKHNRKRHILRDLRHKRNRLRDELSELQAQSNRTQFA